MNRTVNQLAPTPPTPYSHHRVGFSIKDNPELRHFCRHVLYAIEELAVGHASAALYEIKSIEGLVSWGENDTKFRKYALRWARKGGESKMKKKGKKKKCR